ncbi:MAG: glycosyltransferase family 4 protein [Acidimicrobiia bacterium]
MGRPTMRVAIYNAHWPTLGGGEQQAGGLAGALSRDHDVELLVEEEFDAITASERLGFDITPFPQRELEPGTIPFLEASADYDLLVNSSFSSTHASRAGRSLYYVQFPEPHAELNKRRALLIATRRNPYHGWIEYGRGFWLPEFAGHGSWTHGQASVTLNLPRGVPFPFSFRLDANSWPADRHPRVTIELDGDTIFDGPVDHGDPVTVRTEVVGRGFERPSLVTLASDTFVPRVLLGTDDDRELGVVVSHLRLGPASPGVRRGELARLRRVRDLQFVNEFLDSYQLITANSPYTAKWVERLWNRSAVVLSPPVQLRAPGPKRRIILGVGRFFPNVSGHSKKQVELVQAFRLACERGLRDWELHLVGGCKAVDRAYAEEARKAAVGLPVRFHINARGEDVAELFGAAEIFWHAAGFGEDRELRPDRFEHFGITVVEAMSAGAVPLVYAHGGPADIVEAARCGRTYETLDQLASETLALAADDAERRRLSDLGVAASTQYSYDEFAQHARELVAELLATGAERDRPRRGAP